MRNPLLIVGFYDPEVEHEPVDIPRKELEDLAEKIEDLILDLGYYGAVESISGSSELGRLIIRHTARGEI
jgi:hypothetical protein